MARCGICNGALSFEHEHKPDQSGLDDGPSLPRWVVNEVKRAQVVVNWQDGKTLREIAAAHGISHETARAWTEGMSRSTGASRRPHVKG